ncbi:hypothetical protein [Mesorhizobium sp. B2-8-5]|uniref:hypothetical protein n=1 Tax=Mesorhizobium sp. B2-8-5 TaxID=2589903 RepID=UPI00112A394C|nr:hypothetical protein [Mesorhizobium sp. B2-8-5]UCI25106.1 hypothetical protein FJ430_26595 [Mesorhizobium sp. B2-8-5]
MSDSIITISEESVRHEGEQIALAFKEWEARKRAYDKLIEYLLVVGKEDWVPASYVVPEVAGPKASHKTEGLTARNGPTWAGEVLRGLENYPDGATPSELLEVVRQGPMRENALNNPNGIYNAVSRLEKAGEIKRHNGRLFLPNRLDQFMERVHSGEIVDYHGSGDETNSDVLVRVISESDGLEAGEIVEMMSKRGMSAGSVYNTLSKIALKGRVRREGKLYLPVKNEALPEQSESASQITGGEGESSLPNMGSGND